MIKKLHVRPAEGLLIRDEKTQKMLPKEGMIVDESSYWVRRLQDGDVVLVEDASEENAPAKSGNDKAGKEKMGDK